jgi:hypothetical protein
MAFMFVDDHKHDDIRFVNNKSRPKIVHLIIVGFTIVAILLKVGAHVVGKMGNLNSTLHRTCIGL